MIPEIGHFGLILACLLALLLGVLPLAGAWRDHVPWMAMARPLACGQALFVALSWACLVASFLQNDFSVRNVAENSNSMLPALYRFTAAWGSHEGSMLLWVLMQSLWMLAVAGFGRRLPLPVRARVLGVMGLLAAGFMLFVLLASNPFLRLFPVPAQGRDLNPLLQDPGMVFHPPLLYLGYVGFSVAFAFAMATLLGGRPDADWARRARPCTLAAWCFLTLGVMLGSWWAYYELGWGGWWFWDPVENAALMPWLVGTALIHALALTDRRGLFGAWTLLLAILCFSLSLLGTFLVRSGVLSSVHAFAIDPRRGLFILALLLIVVGGSLALFALRAGRLAGREEFDAVSRESLLLANTLLLTVAAATVLLGTFYPLLVEVLGLGRLSVGPPYFDTVFVPLMAPAVFLMGVGPLARWRRAPLPELWTRLRWALLCAALLGIMLPFAGGRWSPMLAVGLGLGCWVLLALAKALHERLRDAPDRGWRALAQPSRAWWGMGLAHLGVAVFVFGVTVVRGFQAEADVRMSPGSSVAVGRHALRFEGVTRVNGPNYEAERGRFVLSRQGETVAVLQPEKRRYLSLPAMPMTEAAIDSGWFGDVYVSLGEAAGDGAWGVRVQHKPFVTWIWGGCALMALGGGVSALDRRYRARRILDSPVLLTRPAG
jgi:cytochrome c-type biogenesis protein CcmF